VERAEQAIVDQRVLPPHPFDGGQADTCEYNGCEGPDMRSSADGICGHDVGQDQTEEESRLPEGVIEIRPANQAADHPEHQCQAKQQHRAAEASGPKVDLSAHGRLG
jgi:hypothetical protein